MNPYITLALGLASVIFFVCYFLISKSNYHERFKLEYHVRNTFPYEFNYHGTFKDNLVGNLFLCIFFIVSTINYATFDVTHTGFMIFVQIMGILSSIMVLVINFVPLRLLKGHIASAVLTLFSGFILPASICVASFSIYKEASGTNDEPVIIKNYNNEKVIIQGIFDEDSRTIYLENVDNITIDGLEVIGGGLGIYYESTSEIKDKTLENITISNCIVHKIRGMHGIAVYAKNYYAPVKNLIMKNCEVYKEIAYSQLSKEELA